MNEEFSNSNAIDVELQVRLMNLVMGESSDFECDQLQLLMEQRAEVAAYYQHLGHLHGLLSDVGAGEPSTEIDESAPKDVWQLSADRRVQVLAVLNGVAHTNAAIAVSTQPLMRSLWSRWASIGVLDTAASVLLCLMLLPSVQLSRSSARRFGMRIKGGTDSGFNMREAMPASPNAAVRSSESTAGLPSAYYLADDVQYFAPDPIKLYVQPGSSTVTPSETVTENFAGKASLPFAETARGRSAGEKLGTVDVDGLDRSRERDLSRAKSNAGGTGSGMPDDYLRKSIVHGWDIKPMSGFGDSLDFFSLSPLDKTMVPAKRNELGLGNWQDLSRGSSVEAPKTATLDWDSEWWNNAPAEIAAAPSVRNWEESTLGLSSAVESRELDSPTLMMTQTPKIVIPAEEDERLLDGEQSRGSVVQGTSLPGIRAKKFNVTQEDEVLSRFDSVLLGEVQVTPTERRGQVILKGKEADLERVNELTKQLAEQTESQSGQEGYLSKNFDYAFGKSASPEVDSINRFRVALDGKLAERKQAEAIDEQSATAEAFSTFSLHVSDVSFKLAQTALSQGQWPEATKIRIEEFVNALDYHDPLPSGNQKVACRVEQAIHPFLMQRNLLRVSMRTAATGRSQNTPLRLTLLLDNSGSMERPDRRQAVARAFQTLTAQLTAADQVTLISFASTPRLLADKVPGNQGEKLLQIIENLPSEGGTNIEAALMLASEKATEHQLAGAQNRIVLLTDGAVNLGDASPANLAKLVTQMRDAGIAFDAAGISAQDLNDEVLEALTRQGDGRYYLLDSAEAASERFAAQIAGALRPSAQNVKVQVEFNPQRVGRYKLLGFEKHRLNKEDFRNDKVDAAELATAEAGVAVYQFEIKPNGKGDVGSVSVRFRDLSTDQMVELRWPVPYEPNVSRLEKAEASMQLAATAALFAAKLTGGPLADSVDLSPLHTMLSNLPEQCANQPRVQQLRAMIEQAKAIGK